MSSIWDERYAMDGYLFGTEPNAFLAAQRALLKPCATCLGLADGEGCNGVWLAEQGLHVHSVDKLRYCAEQSQDACTTAWRCSEF